MTSVSASSASALACWRRDRSAASVYPKNPGPSGECAALANEDDAASITWFPGIGLIYTDCRLIRKFAGGSRTNIATGFVYVVASGSSEADVWLYKH